MKRSIRTLCLYRLAFFTRSCTALCTAPQENERADLCGAGAAFPAPLYQHWHWIRKFAA